MRKQAFRISSKITLTTIACLISMAIAVGAAQRDYVSITDQAGDRLNVNADGTLPISTTLTFATGTIGVSGTVTATGTVDAILTDGTDTALITASGALLIDSDQTIQVNIFARPGVWENINYGVPPTSNSGSNLDPATGTIPMAFFLVNEGTNYIRVSINNTSDATHGLYVGPKGSISGQFMAVTYLSVYNPDAATATVSVMYGRE